MTSVVPLSRSYPARRELPFIDRVDPRIFTRRYFMRCLECTFCHDSCCQHGCDVDAPNLARILEHADALEAYLGVPRAEWMKPAPIEDADFPGGVIQRTQVKDGRCVFLNRGARGCGIHSFCLEKGLDHRAIKPSVCWMFPVTVNAGLLDLPTEIKDPTLICLGEGPTLYESARDDLAYNFGPDLVAELDAIEKTVLGAAAEA